jgi:single-stranded-DNA-specific exonuclease
MLADKGASLVITTDCGITSKAEVEHANQLGLDVIIVDHHTPPPEVPAALAVIDPHLKQNTYPYTGLAAVGVVYKLVQAVYQR